MYTTLLDVISVVVSADAVAAGTGDTQSGTGVDTSGYDGVLFIANITGALSTAVGTLQAQESADNATWGAALANTAAYTNGSGATVNKSALVLDVYQPKSRYVRPQLVRATANLAISSITAILYRARSLPTAQGTTVLASGSNVQL
jgi:hypothetical protein